jgi:uncharacterized protein YkwD
LHQQADTRHVLPHAGYRTESHALQIIEDRSPSMAPDRRPSPRSHRPPGTKWWTLIALLPATLAAQEASPGTQPLAARLEAGIVREHNLVRQNPRAYAQHLRALLPYFDGRLLRVPGAIPLETIEGARAVREAIAVLEDALPQPPLGSAGGLQRGARDHVRDQGPRGGLDHAGSDGSQADDRVSRYGTWMRTIGENLAFGQFGPDDARDVVMSLLIDDGVPSRGHRGTILNGEFRSVGVACGEHAGYGTMCAIVYAGGYDEDR